MENKYKKILNLLILSSMLSLSACNNDENKEVNDYTENYIDEETNYVEKTEGLTLIREQFLKNNNIINLKNINTNNKYFEELVNKTENMYMFEDSEIRKIMIWTIEELQKIFPDENPVDRILSTESYVDSNSYGDIDVYIPIQVDNNIYNFRFLCDPGIEETIKINLENEFINYSKYMYAKNYSNKYGILQSYSYSSVEKTGLNRISIDISSNYDLKNDLMIENINCYEDFNATLTLNNGEDKIEVELTEVQFNKLATLITKAAIINKPVEQLLKENEELLIELYGEDYQRFLEMTKPFTYVKKPV